jgi:ABC-2 type transport system ATP-binding protein
MITADGLVKTFGDLRAVDGVSLRIERGTTFGLLGPNGAGKSTTISMLVGLLDPDEGTVELVGHGSPSKSHEIRRKMGVAPQALALYPELTAAENLKLFARLYGLRGPSLSHRVDWALELSGLVERCNDRVETYSGGMQRRLNLASSLVHDPDLVLLDEPTVGVDPQSRNHIFETIERLKGEGLTVLYTTHYMDEAERLCDRVAIMDAGCILDTGSVDELINRHGGTSLVEVEMEHAADAGQLTRFGGVVDGQTVRIETMNPMNDIARLVESGVGFRSLKLRQPDLETVFLALTGRTLRDD